MPFRIIKPKTQTFSHCLSHAVNVLLNLASWYNDEHLEFKTRCNLFFDQYSNLFQKYSKFNIRITEMDIPNNNNIKIYAVITDEYEKRYFNIRRE